MIPITNITNYSTDELIKLATFARQLLPVNPRVYVGNTILGWHGRGWEDAIRIFIPKISYFPHQYSSCYCFKNLAIPIFKAEWDDVFVEICAHEYFHSYQYTKGIVSSERDAEAYGVGRLLAYLKLKGIEPPMLQPSVIKVHTVKTVDGIMNIKVRNKYVWKR